MPTTHSYIKVPISEFELGKSSTALLPVDIYYEESPYKIQKIKQKGSSFYSGLTLNVKKAGWILLKKEDYRHYVGFVISQGTLALTPIELVSKRVAALNEKIKAILDQFEQNGLDLKYKNLVLNTLTNALHFTIENPVTSKLIEKIENLEQKNSHSLAVAIWSQILLRSLGWPGGEPLAFRVALCAFFHDIGMNEIVDELLQKPSHELTEQDIRVIESHATRGRDILKSITGMPEEISAVAYQHHEHANGTGYPQKLLLDDIHPIARLISLTNRFHEHCLSAQSSKTAFKEAFHQIEKDQDHFDLHLLKGLEEILLIRQQK